MIEKEMMLTNYVLLIELGLLNPLIADTCTNLFKSFQLLVILYFMAKNYLSNLISICMFVYACFVLSFTDT